MYIPKHFKPYELFPEDFLKENEHKKDQLLWLFDDRGLWTIDRLQERYGKTLMNTWHWGGKHKYRGYRPPGCKIGAEWSQHRYGRGFDLDFVDRDNNEVRQEILNNPFDPDFEYITCLEIDISWFHFDVRNWDKVKNGILKIEP